MFLLTREGTKTNEMRRGHVEGASPRAGASDATATCLETKGRKTARGKYRGFALSHPWSAPRFATPGNFYWSLLKAWTKAAVIAVAIASQEIIIAVISSPNGGGCSKGFNVLYRLSAIVKHLTCQSFTPRCFRLWIRYLRTELSRPKADTRIWTYRFSSVRLIFSKLGADVLVAQRTHRINSNCPERRYQRSENRDQGEEQNAESQ